MTCTKSSAILEGLTWPGYRCDVEIIEVYNASTGRIKVMFDGGGVDTFDVTENTMYEFPNAPYPFTLFIVSILYSTIYGYGYITFESCDLEVSEPEPDGILETLIWIKDKLFGLLPLWSSLFPNVSNILTLAGDIKDSVITVIPRLETVKTYIVDNLNEIHTLLDLKMGEVHDSISSGLFIIENNIIDEIRNINITIPSISLEPVILKIDEMKGDIADFVIERVWGYIEDQLFEEDEV